MEKKIVINKKDFFVKEDEFPQIPHSEYNNLIIFGNLGDLEKQAGLCIDISEQYNYEAILICWGSSHGGFLPIKCVPFFHRIYIGNTTDDLYKQIQKNNKIWNIAKSYTLERIHTNLPNLKKSQKIILHIEPGTSMTEHLLQFIKTYHPYILSLTRYNLFNQEVCIVNSNQLLHIPKEEYDTFNKNFSYYYTDKLYDNYRVLQYDNLIHFTVMVKNGGDEFRRMLQRNLSIIDRWTILDTGSTDNTIQNIEEILVGKKKGKLYKANFVDFGTSRNLCLDLAGTKCKFNLMLDDTYVIEGKLRIFLDTIRGDQFADSYSLYIKSGDSEYTSNRVTKSEAKLRYIFKIHEVIQAENNVNVIIPMKDANILDMRSDYMENRTTNRKPLDIQLLNEMVREQPDNPRHLYYLAQTYNLLEDYEKVEEYFLKRINHPNEGFFQEKLDAYFELGRLYNFKLNKPWELCEKYYMQAYELDPKRPDSLYFIGIHWYLEHNYEKAYPYFKKAFELGYPLESQYSLKPTLSFHFLPKFLCEVCYTMNDYSLGEQSARLFIQNNQTNADQYETMVSWYKLYEYANKVPALSTSFNTLTNISSKPILCFVADGGFEPWTGRDILSKGMGGSETYIIEMARYLQKMAHFDVYVFCNCLQEDKFEEVRYKPLSTYFDFISQNKIHSSIISRFSEYLLATYKGNVENVYLVLHDLTPSGNVIPINSKLKQIFCLTEWHVEYFTSIFPQCKNITSPFYYGIDIDKFSGEKTEKIPYKFIYSSFPNRGLSVLLKLWGKIRQQIPQATLHIYSDINGKWANQVAPEEMMLIRKQLENYNAFDEDKTQTNGIHYYGWVNKKTLSEAWKTADIWFYPCKFMETFCLTALESALSRTLAVCNDLAALQNTVGDRGIVIPGDVKTKEWQEWALQELFSILTNPEKKKELIQKNYEWASQLNWKQRAYQLSQQYLFPKQHFEVLKIGAYKGDVKNDTVIQVVRSDTPAIFVEPVPAYYQSLMKNCARFFPDNHFIYINKAVSDKKGKIGIYYPSITNDFDELPWWVEQLASVNPDHCKNHGFDIDLDYIQIPTTTINDIVETYNISSLHYLVVDTEGHDYEVLMAMDLTRLKPEIIIFEHLHMDGYKIQGHRYETLLQHFIENGYSIAHKNGEDTRLELN